MKIQPTSIPGLTVVEGVTRCDDRGESSRLFCERELAPLLGARRIVQINRSRTRAVGTVRGMHYQAAPHAETKFVRCLRGRVWDVAVDLRRGSPTFLAWHAEELTPENSRMFVIPEGCAHGFQALSPDSELLYLHTSAYEPAAEGGVSCTDARLRIAWPLRIGGLCLRDQSHAPLSADFEGLPT